MKTDKRTWGVRLFALLLCLAMTLSAGSVLAAFAENGADVYVEPDFLVDFAASNSVDKFLYFHNTAVMGEDRVATFYFAYRDGTGVCDDPYWGFPLPSGTVDLATHHYLAMLIKTTHADEVGEVRFETTDTAGSFPCQQFSYADTDDWQLIVVDLTDMDTLLFHNGAPVTGALTHLRLDPFGSCTGEVDYAIKAYGLYDNMADAQTFACFESKVQEEDHISPLPDIDYTTYWRGEAFATPDDAYRMGFVEYGYDELYEVSINKLLAQGYNTVVSNVNFNQQYLKDDAEFDLLRRAYEYANRKGMSTWVYDEYQWPSGKAFGLVLEGHDEYEATGIEHRVVTGDTANVEYAISGRDIRIMDALLTDANGSRQVTFTDEALSAQATGAWRLDVYVLRKTYEGEEDPTDFTTLRDVNLLDPGAVNRFIDVTYVKYRDTFGEDFDMVEAFFTDEPQLGNRDKADFAVWTDGFAEVFRERYGYDLKISSIFSGDTDEDRLARLHYYQLVAFLFKTSYMDQITDWCESNGTKSSGHFLFEENMNDHIETYGGDFLQLVGGMSIPGIDLLWVDPDHVLMDNNIGNVMAMRYTKSAAKSASKPDVMAEWNPCTTQTPQFMNDELNTSLGGASITRLCGVNIYQVIDPTRSYTYSEINALNLYIARMNAILDGQREMGDVAVFYPIATVQAYHDADSVHSSTHGGAAPTKSYQINSKYTQLCLELLQNQILFTVVDDQSLAVSTVADSGHLSVGEGDYKTVIVPYAEYMSVEAAGALAQFANAGGRVIFVESKPTHATSYGDDAELRSIVNGMPSIHRAAFDAGLLRDVINNANNLLSISRLSGMPRERLLYGDFTDDDHEISFVVNSSEQDGTMTLSYKDGYEGTYFVYYPGNAMIEAYTGAATVTVPRYQGVFVIRCEEETVTDTTTDTETQTDTDTESAAETTDAATESVPLDIETVDVPETQAESTTTDGGATGGCKAVLPSACMMLMTAAGATVCICRIKKKE